MNIESPVRRWLTACCIQSGIIGCAAGVLITLVPPLVQAQDDISMPRENEAARYAECVAYFEIASEAVQTAGEAATAAAYKELADNAMLIALLLASPGRDSDMAVEVTNARIELSKKQMLDKIDRRNENLVLLINQYHAGCQDLNENPSMLAQEAIQEALDEVE